jgi:tRNA threonylcarbamoyladenosine biosynthesis protein TsaB
MAGVANAGEESVVTGETRKAIARAIAAETTSEYNILAMVVFALETVTRPGSVAIVINEACHARAGDDARTHGERLPGEAMAFLNEHGLAIGDVDLFAIVAGPGSFTGLRVGMAVVQGFALARDRRVVAVPTLEALAEGWRLGRLEPAQGPRPEAQGNPGTREPQNPIVIVSCLDGQRGDVFFAAWELAPFEPIEHGRALVAPRVGRPDDLVRAIEPYLSGQPAVVVGDGRRFESSLARLNLSLEDMPMTLAEVAARTAARRPELATVPHALRPLYIRRPDALLARERAGLPRP